MKKLEQIFLLVGILALGTFAGIKLYSSGYQAYAKYVFEEMLHGRGPSFRGFLVYLARKPFGHNPAPPASPVNNSDVLNQLIYGSGAPPNVKEWSRGRLKAYQDTVPPAAGSVLGRLEIPSIDLSVMVLQGTDDWTLDRAVGHIEGTALPGQTGNIGIAGHRDGFFRGLRKLANSDTIILTTLQGRFQYRIKTIKIVKPSETKVLAPTGKPTLTLVTCYPFYYVGDAPKRFIVTAEIVKAEDATQVAADQARTH